ncbi:hypothetical protein D5086_002205 [Populus alba]|uniref:Uncharacterized protein n=1 Tax=Populus alba TaxID=43335 RepID=A0ACC4D217_POPAL
MESTMGNNNEGPNELWTKALGTIGGDYGLCELCSDFSGKTIWGHTVCSQNYGNCSILWSVQRSHGKRSFGDHQQDWKHLVLVEIEGLRDPSVSEGYVKWRASAASAMPCAIEEPIKVNIEDDLAASAMPRVEVKSPQTIEEPLKRKRVNGELRRQVDKLRIELSKSRKDKATLEGMMLEEDKRRTFLDEQIQSRDAKITKLELKLVEEKIARERSENELKGLSLDWMQSCSEHEAMEMDFSDCQESAKYYQEKFVQVQFELMDRIRRYKDLNKKYIELESKRGGFKDVKAELAAKRSEIKVARIKLDKEREKSKYLDEKLVATERHKDRIDANNIALNRTNMLLIEKMTKTDEQMDEAAAHARIIRINARNVGGDIIRYRRSLAETDAFLGKIENCGFAFLPLAKEFMEERD